MNSQFATGHFCKSFFKKTFLVENYNLGSFSFKQTGFFAYFLTIKTLKILKKQPKYSLTKHTLSTVLLNTSS